MIEPTIIHLEKWMHTYVPEKDLFFLKDEDLIILKKHLETVLIVPKEEFLHTLPTNKFSLSIVMNTGELQKRCNKWSLPIQAGIHHCQSQ